MKRILLMAMTLLTLAWASPRPAAALQQFYLGTSPDGQTRVVVSQRLLRRVGDKFFFEYPVSLVDKATGGKLELYVAGPVLVHESERGTFTYDDTAIHIEWAPSGDKLVVFYEQLEGDWQVLLVDRAERTQLNLTKALKESLLKKAGRSLECEEPHISVFSWITPLKPVFALDTNCGKHQEDKPDMHKMEAYRQLAMYDTTKDALRDCVDCAQEKAIKKFSYMPKPTPTPTPNVEETPTTE